MYKVMVVDDEPIILSGITHLLHWQDIGCTIEGAYRNGKDAYVALSASPADIIITDIKMPVMDGLELLKKCSTDYPDIVFIILTSLEEFRLVKEAIRYNVCEYLVKTELDESLLRNAVLKAEAEVERRNLLRGRGDGSEADSRRAAELISNLLVVRDIPPGMRAKLNRDGVCSSFAFIAFMLEYPQESDDVTWYAEDYERLYEWEADIIRKILPSIYPSYILVGSRSGEASRIVYYVHDVDGAALRALNNRLEDKVRKASRLVTKVGITLVSSAVYTGGAEKLGEARDDIEDACTAFYLDKSDPSVSGLELDSVYSKVEAVIREKDIAGLEASFRLISSNISFTDHSLWQLMFTLSALRSAVWAGVCALGIHNQQWLDDTFSLVPYISRRSMALAVIDDIKTSIESELFRLSASSSSPVIDKAREYVISHIDERISLSDVASYAGVSEGYMSKSFKKVMGKSLVDYINTMKVDKAKEIIKTSGYTRINEIALSLGFDNIYYFSKVFRKITGQSPSEYIKECQREGV